jgi:hypothetical protein
MYTSFLFAQVTVVLIISHIPRIEYIHPGHAKEKKTYINHHLITQNDSKTKAKQNAAVILFLSFT